MQGHLKEAPRYETVGGGHKVTIIIWPFILVAAGCCSVRSNTWLWVATWRKLSCDASTLMMETDNFESVGNEGDPYTAWTVATQPSFAAMSTWQRRCSSYYWYMKRVELCWLALRRKFYLWDSKHNLQQIFIYIFPYSDNRVLLWSRTYGTRCIRIPLPAIFVWMWNLVSSSEECR